MDTIYKILENCEVKKVGERQYEFTASTADMDRDGEVIDVSGWDLKNFKKNPVIMFAHSYNTLPIGKATKVGVRDGKLMNVVEFPPEGTYEFADTVARLVDAGYLKTESVGFIPKKWEDAEFEEDEKGKNKPRRTYTKQELLEISIVPVPSNPNALMNAVSEGVITQKQFDAIAKPEETSEYYRIPVPGEEGKHDGHKIRTMDVSKDKGIKGLYCVDDKKIITYMFDKEKWDSMAECREWMKEHMPKSHEVSQSEIMDEIDYLKSLVENEGLSEEAKISATELVKIICSDDLIRELAKRLPADDIAVKDIKPEELLTNQDILESIKRIMEVKSC